MSGQRSCKLEGCTVDETGICALAREPLSCENRINNPAEDGATPVAQDSGDVLSVLSDRLGTPVLEQPERASRFSSSRALGMDDLTKLMGSRYVNIVGILGDPESGKTACLASLYLLISEAKLQGWGFADSKSLTAFEDIARGARDWNNGTSPDQMTMHTELADDHGPGFLHLRLVKQSDGRRIDLALPDIPGEWTQALVNTARSDRLDFMKAADAIWIVLDGRILADIERRQGLIARVGQLAARLSTMFEGRVPRLLIVVTHQDRHILTEDIISRLQAELTRRSIYAEIVGVAPFSDAPDSIAAGFGIADLISKTVGNSGDRPAFWQAKDPMEGDRSYLSFRRDR